MSKFGLITSEGAFVLLNSLLVVSLFGQVMGLSNVILGLLLVISVLSVLLNKPDFSLLSKYKWLLWVCIVIPAITSLLGLTQTVDFTSAMADVNTKVVLFLLPLNFVLIPKNYLEEVLKKIVILYPRVLAVTLVLYLLLAAYLSQYGYGNYFFYNHFGVLANIQPIYLSIIINLGAVFVLFGKDLKSTTRILERYLLLLVFAIIQLIVATKMGIFLFGVILLYHVLTYIKDQKIPNFYIVLTTVGFLMLSILPLSARLNIKPSSLLKFDSKENIVSNLISSDIKPRFLLWKSNIEGANKVNLFYGVGTGGSREYRRIQYKAYRLTSAIEDDFNAHNQWFEEFYYHGLLGSLFFILSLIFLTACAFKSKSKLAIAISCLLFLSSSTESILQRQWGVYLYALGFSLVVILYAQSRKSSIKQLSQM